HVRGSLWNSDQGPLRVELDQPADLSSRRLTHRLQPGGEVVATISDIRYETQAFPWDELTEIRRLCGGPPAPSDGSYGGLTAQPAVARFEAGGTIPTLPVLQRLARALHADLTVTVTPHTDVA